jgi:hypothetical protein
MDLSFPNAGEIDSLCHALDYAESDTPAAITPRCKDDAVTWYEKVDGTRLYVCEKHALEPFRFPAGERDRSELPDDYNELRSLASDRGITLQSPERKELENRLLSPRDPEEVEPHPTAVRCSTCSRITFSEDTTPVERRCRSCDEGVPELDPEDYAVTTPPEG